MLSENMSIIMRKINGKVKLSYMWCENSQVLVFFKLQQHGTVLSASISPGTNGESIGIVLMRNFEEAKKAVEALNNTKIGGKLCVK